MSTRPAPGKVHVNIATLVCGVIMFCGLLTAAVVLGIAGWDTEKIIGLLAGIFGLSAPLLFLIDRLVVLVRDSAETRADVGEVKGRLNGDLDARLDAAADRAATKALAAIMEGPTSQFPVVTTNDQQQGLVPPDTRGAA